MIVELSPVEAAELAPITVRVPPDKSILHRLLIIGSLTESVIELPECRTSTISQDVLSTLRAMQALGVPIEITGDRIVIHGVGLRGLKPPSGPIDCGNSGTTARLLLGLLSGQSFESVLVGDASLSRRPMKRLAVLLEEFGASIESSEHGTLPVRICGQQLHGASIELRVASAQIKSALLLSGVFSQGETTISGATRSRDHTERMLKAFGFGIETSEEICLTPTTVAALPDRVLYHVPGDISSAAFLFAAAILLRRRLTVNDVMLNPTRTRFLDLCVAFGVRVDRENVRTEYGEERGDVTMYGDLLRAPLQPICVSGDEIAMLIDELPILMVLSLFADGASEFRDLGELRLKESDRLRLCAEQFRRFGVEVEETGDDLVVHGKPGRRLCTSAIEHGGDHRLAMAFSIASLFADGPVTIPAAESVSISYSTFYSDLAPLCGPECVRLQI